MTTGDRIRITGFNHPWRGYSAELIARETFGLGWVGWRISIDGGRGECFVRDGEFVCSGGRR